MLTSSSNICHDAVHSALLGVAELGGVAVDPAVQSLDLAEDDPFIKGKSDKDDLGLAQKRVLGQTVPNLVQRRSNLALMLIFNNTF